MTDLDHLEELRFIARADVYKAGAFAGYLERNDAGEIGFRYSADYSGEPVASTLPVSDTAIRTHGGGVPPFFAGLLPEGHRLTVLRHATKTSADDELTLLLAVGSDAPGDVQVVPEGRAPSEPPTLASGDPGDLDFRKFADAVDRHAIPGVQPKTSASMLTTPLNLPQERALLKLNTPEHPHLVENEALHLKAAAGMKLPVAAHRVVWDINGVPGLLVARFDRHVTPGSGLERLAMEDAGQVLDILPAAKYTVSAEKAVTALARRCSAPMVATRNLYLQFLFAWLTGNGDLHAKNIAVLRSPSGRWNIAPIYDIPCTAVYRDFTMALPVAGRTSRLRKHHWDAFADAIGLPQAAAASAMRLALTASARVNVDQLPFEGSLRHGAERELRFRRSALDN